MTDFTRLRALLAARDAVWSAMHDHYHAELEAAHAAHEDGGESAAPDTPCFCDERVHVDAARYVACLPLEVRRQLCAAHLAVRGGDAVLVQYQFVQPDTAAIVGISCADLDAAIAKASAEGLTIDGVPWA